MGKLLNRGKSKDFTELRVYIDPDLAEKFHNEASDERRTYGKQLEVILEQWYLSKGLSND